MRRRDETQAPAPTLASALAPACAPFRAIAPGLTLALSLAAVFAASLALGDRALPAAEILGALTGDRTTSPASAMIVLDLRLPRAALAALAGAALGLAGTIAQTVMRNPLAEPGLLGVNAGAAVAALAPPRRVKTSS
ncbi:MAG: iron chelate uptake ABC transporter family permease subunit, partial [Pseudomonadota bacterium]|nr:iron chelate uptake ABC transporter family permease subunit [Pseudomonadota bacterium]